jgi:hypothetical protein
MKCLDCLSLVCFAGQMEESSLLGTQRVYSRQYKATGIILGIHKCTEHRTRARSSNLHQNSLFCLTATCVTVSDVRMRTTRLKHKLSAAKEGTKHYGYMAMGLGHTQVLCELPGCTVLCTLRQTLLLSYYLPFE